jgi:hypothetical protein
MASHTNTCNEASRHVHRENGDRCPCSVFTSLLHAHWQSKKKGARWTEAVVQWNHETKWIPINLELCDDCWPMSTHGGNEKCIKILLRNFEGKIPLGRCRRAREDNIKINWIWRSLLSLPASWIWRLVFWENLLPASSRYTHVKVASNWTCQSQ